MSSLTLLDQGEFSDVYIENLYVDNIYSDQAGQTTFNDPVYIGNDTLEQHIRNQISVAGALTYNASSGLIGGITIDNVGHNVTLSITANTILSADVGGAIQSKWALDFTANVLYPSVAVTGIVAVNNLVVSGSGTINNGLTVSKQSSGLATTIVGIDNTTLDYDLRGAFRALENTPTQSTTGGLEVPTVVASIQRAGRGGVVNSANVDFRLSSYEKNATQSRTQCDIHLHNGYYADAPTRVMTLRGNGNVGIGNNAPNSTLTVSGNMGLSGAMTISGTLNVSGNVNITGSVSFNNGISVSGNATFNNNVFINSAGGIGIGQQPIGGVHRLATKGRIRANAYDAVDSSGVLELVSNGGIIDYLYSADNGKAYFDGTSDGLNVQIGLSANSNFQVAGSSIHNAGIYVVGGSEINGTLLVDDRFRVLGSATFTNTSADIGVPIRGHQGLFITGAVGVSNKIYSQGLAVSGASSFDSGGLTITGGALNVIGISSVGDITLARNNSATVGRVLSFTFGTANAGVQAQGIEFRDLTTAASQCGVYGGSNTLRFYSGGTQKMAIGANVDFSAMPLLNSNPITTDNITDVGATNKYFTNALARGAISALSPLSYDSGSGVMSLVGSAISKWGSGLNNTIYNLNTTGSVSMSAMVVSGNATFGNSIITVSGAINISGGFMITGNATFNNVISVSAGVLVGNAPVESNVLISARKAGGCKIKVASTNASDAELWMSNPTSSYSWYAHNSVNSCRLYNYGTSADVLTVLSNGSVGIGTTNPTHRLTIDGGLGTSTYLGGVQMFAATQNRFYSVGQGADNNIFSGWVYNATTANAYGLVETYGGNNPLVLQATPNGKVGIGATAPAFKLDVLEASNTTARIKSNSTTGYSQLFLQANGIAGAGLYLNGSAGTAEGGANCLTIKNNMGSVLLRNNSDVATYGITGGICITGILGYVGVNQNNPQANLHVRGSMIVGEGSNSASTSSGDKGGLFFGVNDEASSIMSFIGGYLSRNVPAGGSAEGGLVFNTRPQGATVQPLYERMRIDATGTVLIGQSDSRGVFSTLINNVEQVLGRLAIKGYSSGDQNPVMMFQEWNGGLAGGREHYLFVDGANGFRTATSTGAVPRLGMNIAPAYQIQLSTDSAGKPTTNTWTIVSDERLKEDIEDANLDICYENMKLLKLKRFKYKDDWLFDETGNRKTEDNKMLGFIAQEVKQVFPKAITIIDDTEQSGIEDLHTLNTDQLIKSSYGALQKLIQKVEQRETDRVKERIQYKAMEDKQNNKITKLEKEITALKMNVQAVVNQLAFKGIQIKLP